MQETRSRSRFDTRTALIVLILSTLLYHSYYFIYKPNEFSLELVQVLFRHGERAPLAKEMYPNDPHHGSSYEPWGVAQLTNEGKMREYSIGKMLRQRYNDFLGDLYHPKDVYARSTDIDRTKMSLQLVLAGLYPPSDKQNWNPDLPWLAIPTHYAPERVDNLLRPQACPMYEEALEEVRQLKEIRDKSEVYTDVLKYLTNETGMNVKTLTAAYEIFNLLAAQKAMNLTLPEWCTENIYKKMEDIVFLEYEIRSYTATLKRLTGGMLIRQFIENMNITRNKRENPRKIYLYSGHEINIAAFTRAHDIHIPKLPSYGSTIIVEKLRNIEGKLFIKMLLWTGVSEQLITLKLKNCDEICPIDTYLDIVKDVIPSDDDINCYWDTISKEELKNLFVEKIYLN
ncbi:PREDICTED: venom acid phosphatase Acph-1-like [Polistes canadensis]|uniref:venom acid phosphatase Acph-1-like n=1 Tax=Polistes canadensis TaxID=91411 RepID=UPI000718DB38|nr:PREDICTED: venom acid phosphatase Acph-1-like [Polistes canadensis]